VQADNNFVAGRDTHTHTAKMVFLPNLHIVDALCLFVGVLYPT
jgi:hypothetical protein